MSRQYCGNPEGVEYFYRSGRSLPQTMSKSAREQCRSYPIGNRPSRTSPVQESDSDKSGNTPRRRIAVAVRMVVGLYPLAVLKSSICGS